MCDAKALRRGKPGGELVGNPEYQEVDPIVVDRVHCLVVRR